MTVRVKTDKSTINLSHRDVSHSERGEDDWVLVKMRVRGGDKFRLRWWRVNQGCSRLTQDDVLRS